MSRAIPLGECKDSLSGAFYLLKTIPSSTSKRGIQTLMISVYLVRVRTGNSGKISSSHSPINIFITAVAAAGIQYVANCSDRGRGSILHHFPYSQVDCFEVPLIFEGVVTNLW